MNIQLIDGEFNPKDAMELITQITYTKIKYHENKIANGCVEEDIKYRESKIKELQKELSHLRIDMNNKTKNVTINTMIKITE
jgi:hypothetical protein